MSGVNPDSSPRITRRHFLVGAGAAAAGLALYSGEIARHELDLVPRTLAISNLPSAFNGFRIAQISDIHLDEFTEPFFLERVVRHVNALAADMVVLTGDFVTHGSLTFMNGQSAAHRCAEILSTLTCPLRFACLGNHDVAVSAPLVINALTSNGIPVLVDEHVPIERNGSRFWLAGVNDPGTTNPRLDLAVPPQPDGPVILMAHEPDYANTVRKHPRGQLVDVMLSGHTHGGQIRLPFLGALVLPPMGRIYAEGLFHLGNMQLYVNRGIGAVGIPFRLNCPPEITIFTLQSA
ncbi:MAG TPA: metallophosphoesterase [Edaphobacter sp.]|uniref:metallophosphoesterase n=1 Tax=Edaphobacter sp. TaxID=1934404 RepID=UPI002B95BFF5|nr:metallophosphoesterase [Edaphobacter sp.]HUZ96893.1 metallophosphoesterase [Edaphobacter sp.]